MHVLHTSQEIQAHSNPMCHNRVILRTYMYVDFICTFICENLHLQWDLAAQHRAREYLLSAVHCWLLNFVILFQKSLFRIDSCLLIKISVASALLCELAKVSAKMLFVIGVAVATMTMRDKN